MFGGGDGGILACAPFVSIWHSFFHSSEIHLHVLQRSVPYEKGEFFGSLSVIIWIEYAAMSSAIHFSAFSQFFQKNAEVSII
jgi:hypothetical protein